MRLPARRAQRTKAVTRAGLRRARTNPRVDKLQRDYREALEREAATAEILRIIAASPANRDAVFQAITSAGTRLIPDTRVSLMLIRQGMLDYAAYSGVSTAQKAAMARMFPIPLDRLSVATTAILDRRVVNISDIRQAGRRYRRSQQTSGIAGWRAILSVPLLKANEAIGTISVSRATPGAFTKTQIALVRTFAVQAVIAIENARLFNETKEALDQQRASAEILRIVSRSMADAQPVFRAILDSAIGMFEGMDATLWMVRGEDIHAV